MAYNLANHGTYSNSCQLFWEACDSEALVPTYYREPVYPALLAAGILLNSDTRSMTRSEFWPEPELMSEKSHATLRMVNSLLLFGVAIISGLIVFFLTTSSIAAYITLFLVGLSPGLIKTVPFFLSENTAAFFLSAMILFLVAGLRKGEAWLFALSGFSLGLLALTKAAYLFSAPLVLVVIGLYGWRTGSWKKSSLLFAAYIASFIIVVFAWMWRNQVQFGDFTIAERGGTMVTTRLYFNRMTRDEYLASFMIWAPSSFGRKYLRDNYDPEIRERFDRRNPDGFYRASRAYAAGVLKEKGRAEGDAILKREAIREMVKHPLKHFLVSISMAVRGMFVESDTGFVFGGLNLKEISINPTLFSSMFLLLLIALWKRNPELLALVIFACFSFAFHACFSNSRARYNQPILPVLWMSLVVLCYYLFALLSRYRKSAFGQPEEGGRVE